MQNIFTFCPEKARDGGIKNESGELCGNTPSTHAKTQIVGAYRFLPLKISPFRF